MSASLYIIMSAPSRRLFGMKTKKARSTKLRALLFQSCYLLGYYFSSAKYLMVRTI